MTEIPSFKDMMSFRMGAEPIIKTKNKEPLSIRETPSVPKQKPNSSTPQQLTPEQQMKVTQKRLDAARERDAEKKEKEDNWFEPEPNVGEDSTMVRATPSKMKDQMDAWNNRRRYTGSEILDMYHDALKNGDTGTAEYLEDNYGHLISYDGYREGDDMARKAARRMWEREPRYIQDIYRKLRGYGRYFDEFEKERMENARKAGEELSALLGSD